MHGKTSGSAIQRCSGQQRRPQLSSSCWIVLAMLLLVSLLLAVGVRMRSVSATVRLPASIIDVQLPSSTEDPELQVTGIFLKAVRGTTSAHSTVASNRSMPIVLDIGMNLGRFTLLSAQLGGKVIAIEPQPACISSVSQELQKQPWLMQQVTILNAAVGREPGVLKVPVSGCDPAYGVGGVEKKVTAAAAMVPILPIAAFVRDYHSISLAKVDVEGAEVQVLQQLLPLAQSGQLQQLVVEVMPGNWAARGGSLNEGITVLQQLQRLAAKSVLLTDPAPFKMTKHEVHEPGVPGKLYSTFDVEQLVHDRLNYDTVNEPLPHGCNVWFVFTELAA